MIQGHGDDGYQYEAIRTDFSSNIAPHASLEGLMTHLATKSCLLSHYPEPEAWSLESMIAQRLHIDPQQVVVTSGATEAIYLVAQTFRWQPVIPAPTFSEYADACRQFPPTDTNRTICWLCNPNNPTGAVRDAAEVRRLLDEHDLVVVDQSYEYYSDQLVMSAQEGVGYSRLVQIHSLTKTYSVPGLRLGYITAPAPLADAIRQHLRPWSVSSVAVEAGKYLLQHDELRCIPDWQEARRLAQQLQQVNRLHVVPTHTNFMLCQLEVGTAAALKDYLVREHSLLIRDASNFRSLSAGHFRVAAQQAAENDALVAAIKAYIKLCTK